MLAYVGSRTTKERDARGEGISIVNIDDSTGELELISIEKGWVNPSYLALNISGDRLYTVHGDGSEVSAFVVDKASRSLQHINTQITAGKNPVHLALSPDQSSLVVSNHLSSNLAVLPIEEDGALGPLRQLVQLSGERGPHRIEQPFSKPHFNPFDPSGRYVVVSDKGLNRIFSFTFKDGMLGPAHPQEVATKETAGPRNVVFHQSKPWAYAINELDSTVVSYNFNPNTGVFMPFQVTSALSDLFTGDSRAAGISLDNVGRTLYTSHRGEDSIAVMEVDDKTGRVKLIQTVSSDGKSPRFFAVSFSGKWLYVLNEDSDTIVTFSVDAENGCLSPTGLKLQTGSPVCMVFGV